MSQPTESGEPAIEAAYLREKGARQEAEQTLAQLARELAHARAALTEERRLLANARADLQRAHEYALRSGGMATVGRLAVGVAHEIRNPVALINGNLQTLGEHCAFLDRVLGAYKSLADCIRSGGSDMLPGLLDSVDSIAAQGDFGAIIGDAMEIIDDSASRAAQVAALIGHLQGFSQGDGKRSTAVDINECLESALEIARSEIGYECEVHREFDALPPVECHPGEIRQVFLNLIVHASRVIAGAGTITVASRRADDAVEVDVVDDGSGLPADAVSRIFEPSFAMRDSNPGTEVGLALSLALVEKHGGSIGVDSAPGRGTRFTVRLPTGASRVEAA